MKERSKKDPSDPRGWIYQAAIHGTYAIPGQDDWNQCKHGHSRFFLSWHRMYLYYFERILREASGDPSLTLPYWNYAKEANRSIPMAFLQPPTAENSLYEPIRLDSANAGGIFITGAYKATDAMTALNFDDVNDGLDGFSSLLADVPHRDVHGAVGGLMADPINAALDPLFFLHHANIDRLWEGWLLLRNERHNPTDDDWLRNHKFNFYDENKKAVILSGQEILDTAKQLNYRYDDYTTTPEPIELTQRVELQPLQVGQQEKLIAAYDYQEKPFFLGQRQTKVDLSLESTAKQKLRSLIRVPGSRNIDAKSLSGKIKLILGDLKADAPIEGYFEVYIDLPIDLEETKINPDRPEFVGLLSFFDVWGHHDTLSKHTIRVDLSHFDFLSARGDSFTIMFLRRGMEVPGHKEPPHFNGNPSIGSIKLTLK